MDEHSIFMAALESESEQARSELLREACGEDDTLRQRVTRLLELHEGASDFLERPVLSAQVGGDVTEGPGSRIGSYKLLEQVGEGGMGVVYMAAQQEPIKRKIALKIIKPGMDTKQVIARFEAERQALALMEHKNIARVLDAGATDSGRPYFVMELVRGIPVTDYCQHERLEPEARLQLFIDVCNAVQHAHQKGIIHRDIKPSNVMVTLHDGEPVVKMIDFGVAKATNQQLTDRTLFTNYAQMIGTPLYMSPEQAEMSGLDVDTRSDIYSLGVLLYELLTDTTPFEKDRLKEVGYDEMRRIICEEDPPKPSTRLSTIGAAPETISDQRRADARRMSQTLRGELDWIVIKALDKNRLRRYQTAKDFADDVQRYLAGEPVEACPPSVAYRTRKLLGKYRGIAAAVCAIGLLLVVGTIVATSLAIRATRAETNAEQAQATAEKEAATATAISDFLRKELLGQASPYENPDRDLRLREVLDRASERIDGHFDGPPLVEAEIRVTLATTYYHLGEYEESARHFDRAHQLCVAELGERHPKTLSIASQRAFHLSTTAGSNASVAALEETLKLQEAALPPEHSDTLLTMAWLAWRYIMVSRFDEAQSLFDRVIPAMKRAFGPEHPQTLDCLDSLARMYSYQERYEESEKLHQQVLESRRRVLGEDHPQYHDSLSALADLKMVAGEAEEALDLYDRVVALRRRVQGESHPSTLANERDVAQALRKVHRLEAAEKRCLETLNSHRQRYGEDDGRTWYMMELLAAVYQTQARYAESLPLREAVLNARRHSYGNTNESTIAAMSRLASVYLALERFHEAEKLFQEMVDTRTRMYEKDDARTLSAMIRLAYGYQQSKQLEDAERVLKDVAKRRERILGGEDPDTLYCVFRLGFVYKAWRKHVESEQHFRRAWDAGPRAWGSEDRSTLSAGNNLAESLRKQDRLEEAEKLCREVLAMKLRVFGEDDITTVYSVRELATICRLLGRLDEAAELSERDISIRRKIQGDSHPELFDALARLGDLAALYERRNDGKSAQSIKDRVTGHLLDIRTSLRERFGEHESTLVSIQRLADISAQQGQLGEALKLQQEIVDTCKQLHGPDDQRTLDASRRLAYHLQNQRRYNDAARIQRDTVERQTQLSGRHDPKTLEQLMRLGFIYKRHRKLAEAEELFRELWRVSPAVLGPEDGETLQAGNQLAVVLRHQRRLEEADSICREVLETRRRVLGEDDILTADSLGELATICRLSDRLGEAAELGEQVIKIRRKIEGDSHPNVFEAIERLADLAALYEHRDDPNSAQSIRERVIAHALDLLKSQREHYGDKHEDTLALIQQVADVLAEQRQLGEAQKLQQEIFDTRMQLHGPDDQRTLDASRRLAYRLQRLRRFDDAAGIMRDTIERQTRLSGRDHPRTLEQLMQLGVIYKLHRKLAEAEELLTELWRVSPGALGPEDSDTLRAGSQLAVVLGHQNRLEEAESLCREVLATRTRVFGEEHRDTLNSLSELTAICTKAGRLDEVRELLNRIVKIRRESRGDKHSGTLDAIQRLYQHSFLYGQRDDFETTVSIRTRVHDLYAEILGEEARKTLDVLAMLAVAYKRAGDWQKTYETSARLIESRSDPEVQKQPPYHAMLWNTEALVQLGRLDEAEQLMRKCVALWEESGPENHGNFPSRSAGTIVLHVQLGEVLTAAGKYEEAESVLLKRQAMASISELAPWQQRHLLTRLVALYKAWNKQDQAARWRDELNSLDS